MSLKLPVLYSFTASDAIEEALGQHCMKCALGCVSVVLHLSEPSPMKRTGPCSSCGPKLFSSMISGSVSVSCSPFSLKMAV